MSKLYFLYLKLKLINYKNINFIFFSKLYKLTKLSFFNKLSVIFTSKFKSLPFHFIYFEKINQIVSKNAFELDYNNKKILEIGGGNFWGLMPFFAKHNAYSHTNIDIIIDDKIINSAFVWKKFNNKISSYVSKDNIKKLKYYNIKTKIEDLEHKELFDSVVSISCLEHVYDIESFFLNIKKHTKPNSTHLHLVNFTNHLNKNDPFKYMYTEDKNSFLKKYNTNINLLRLNDYKEILNKYNFIYKIITIEKQSIEKLNINSYWIEKYSLDELSVKSALIVINGFKIK